MIKVATTRATKKVATKKAAPKKSAAKVVSRSVSPKARPAKSHSSKSAKVDYYPNRMTVAVSVLAGTILVLVTAIAVLGSRG